MTLFGILAMFGAGLFLDSGGERRSGGSAGFRSHCRQAKRATERKLEEGFSGKLPAVCRDRPADLAEVLSEKGNLVIASARELLNRYFCNDHRSHERGSK